MGAELHAKYMEHVDSFLSMEFDGVPLTFSGLYMSCGIFALETDLRWQVVDTVRPSLPLPLCRRRASGSSSREGRTCRSVGNLARAWQPCRALW